MKNRRLAVGLVVAGLVGSMFATMSVDAATKPVKAPKAATKTTKKSGTVTTAAPATTAAPTSAAPAATPTTAKAATPAADTGGKAGGDAVFGTDADCDNYLPGNGSWSASCGVVANSIYDKWLVLGADLKPIPNLLESIKSSGDYKTWSVVVKSGIKFHNGEPLDAAAFVANMEHVRTGAITSPLFGNLIGCETTGAMTAQCNMKTGWVSFPAYLVGQTGAAAAPASIKSKDGKHPIGTGAFMCKGDCWVFGQKLTVVKNPTYWRKGLPKLDSIEFRPIPDEDQRLAQLNSGQIQFMLSANFLTGRDLKAEADAKKINLFTSEVSGAVTYDIVNLAKPGPLQDVRVRRAWAMAIDQAALRDARAPGATLANGPFAKGALGALDDTGYPKFDLEKAKALLDDYKKDKGITGGLKLTLATTAVADNQQTIRLQKTMLDKAGFDIQLAPGLEQTAYIGSVMTGQFDVITWNWMPYADPDLYRTFLGSDGCGGPAACPRTIGVVALNWGRVVDGQVDAAFDQIRTVSDPVVRKRAAETVSKIYGDQAYIFWKWRSRGHFASCAKCGGVEDAVGVNGEKIVQAPTAHLASTPWLTIN